jgi:hypothetical protein
MTHSSSSHRRRECLQRSGHRPVQAVLDGETDETRQQKCDGVAHRILPKRAYFPPVVPLDASCQLDNVLLLQVGNVRIGRAAIWA